MSETDFLKTQFDRRLQCGIRVSIEIMETGLFLGAGTRLARPVFGPQGPSRFLSKEEQERLFALLSIAQRRPIAANKLYSIAAGLNDWDRGEKALAHIRLAQASLPPH